MLNSQRDENVESRPLRTSTWASNKRNPTKNIFRTRVRYKAVPQLKAL
jgi:hypothetical protein